MFYPLSLSFCLFPYIAHTCSLCWADAQTPFCLQVSSLGWHQQSCGTAEEQVGDMTQCGVICSITITLITRGRRGGTDTVLMELSLLWVWDRLQEQIYQIICFIKWLLFGSVYTRARNSLFGAEQLLVLIHIRSRSWTIRCVADALLGRELIKHRLIKITTVVKGQRVIA